MKVGDRRRCSTRRRRRLPVPVDRIPTVYPVQEPGKAKPKGGAFRRFLARTVAWIRRGIPMAWGRFTTLAGNATARDQQPAQHRDRARQCVGGLTAHFFNIILHDNTSNVIVHIYVI